MLFESDRASSHILVDSGVLVLLSKPFECFSFFQTNQMHNRAILQLSMLGAIR